MNRHQPMLLAYPRRKDAEGRPLCGWCGKPLVNHRRRWCGEACLYQAWERCSPRVAGERLFKRRRGICEKCGINLGELRDAVQSLREWRYDGQGHELAKAVVDSIERAMVMRGWSHAWWESLWQAHHVVPHAQGGKLEPSNLMLLCTPCHKAQRRKRIEVAKLEAERMPV